MLLYVALIWTSTVSSLLIIPPQPLKPPDPEPDAVPVLSNSTVGTNDSLSTFPTLTMLDQGYNTSLSKLNLSANPTFFCDEGWGRDLNLRMCLEALASVPWPVGPDSRPLSFGPREARVFDIGLPRRFMSADGICAIQPFVVPGKVSAHVSPLNAYSATAAVIQRCVGGNPSQGGQVRSFEGDNNLAVTVSEYDPHLWSGKVHCSGSTGGPGIIASCNNLANNMDASESLKTFGPHSQPYDYATPYTIKSDDRCYLSITVPPNRPPSRTASWHEIWEGVILVNAMCIRAGKRGVFTVNPAEPEEHRRLQIEIGDLRESNDLTLPVTVV